jgi:hypothetical protein
MAVVARKTGRSAPQGPPFPAVAMHLWDAFLRLHRARGSSGFGPVPISYGDIAAYMRLLDQPLQPWEVETLRGLDDAYLTAAAEAAAASPPAGGPPSVR